MLHPSSSKLQNLVRNLLSSPYHPYLHPQGAGALHWDGLAKTPLGSSPDLHWFAT
jgi:hypothetical protein